jgi:hypothetical protein
VPFDSGKVKSLMIPKNTGLELTVPESLEGNQKDSLKVITALSAEAGGCGRGAIGIRPTQAIVEIPD